MKFFNTTPNVSSQTKQSATNKREKLIIRNKGSESRLFLRLHQPIHAPSASIITRTHFYYKRTMSKQNNAIRQRIGGEVELKKSTNISSKVKEFEQKIIFIKRKLVYEQQRKFWNFIILMILTLEVDILKIVNNILFIVKEIWIYLFQLNTSCHKTIYLLFYLIKRSIFHQ